MLKARRDWSKSDIQRDAHGAPLAAVPHNDIKPRKHWLARQRIVIFPQKTIIPEDFSCSFYYVVTYWDFACS